LLKDKLKESDIVAISASLAVKRSILDKIGGFDEKEAVTTEDLDLSWRIWIAGYRVLLSPKSIIYHHTKSVVSRKYMNTSYRKIYFHLAKNSFRSILKNYEIQNSLCFLILSLLINYTRAILVIPSSGFSAIIATTQALIWNLYYLLDTLVERSKVQRTRVVSDKILFEKIFIRNGFETLSSFYRRKK